MGLFFSALHLCNHRTRLAKTLHHLPTYTLIWSQSCNSLCIATLLCQRLCENQLLHATILRAASTIETSRTRLLQSSSLNKQSHLKEYRHLQDLTHLTSSFHKLNLPLLLHHRGCDVFDYRDFWHLKYQ